MALTQGTVSPPSWTGAMALLWPTRGLPAPGPSLPSRVGCALGLASRARLVRGGVAVLGKLRVIWGKDTPLQGAVVQPMCVRGVCREKGMVTPHGRPRGNPSSCVSALPPWRRHPTLWVPEGPRCQTP